MPLRIEQLERKLAKNAEIVVEHICLENLGVLLVLFVVARGHVADDVQELDQQLQGAVEFSVVNGQLVRGGFGHGDFFDF